MDKSGAMYKEKDIKFFLNYFYLKGYSLTHFKYDESFYGCLCAVTLVPDKNIYQKQYDSLHSYKYKTMYDAIYLRDLYTNLDDKENLTSKEKELLNYIVKLNSNEPIFIKLKFKVLKYRENSKVKTLNHYLYKGSSYTDNFAYVAHSFTAINLQKLGIKISQKHLDRLYKQIYI